MNLFKPKIIKKSANYGMDAVNS